MALHLYTPELKQPKPEAQIEARLSHGGRHYFLDTPLTLAGRGVNHLRTYEAKDLTTPRKVGWNSYRVTEAAFRAICDKHAVSYEMLLD